MVEGDKDAKTGGSVAMRDDDVNGMAREGGRDGWESGDEGERGRERGAQHTHRHIYTLVN